MTAPPLFSVIIPLEYHRGQWERCWRAWRNQTLPPSRFETILVVPPGFPEREQVAAQAGPHDRVEHAAAAHDIGLCAAGAARAGGRFLFFTESHCWPEADVLERCLQAFHDHPEWSALSCRSVRITHNRLSHIEADMYEEDIEQGLTLHPWRKVLDHCFVTRRESYERCGGLRPDLGHFAEWVLAANYFALGQAIGYVPEALLHHYYVGDLAELRAFTLDFIAGEMRYFASPSPEPGRHLLEMPREWIGQGSRDRRLARRLLSIAMRDLCSPSRARLRRPDALLGAPLRWLLPAAGGDGSARAGAVGRVWLAHAAATASRVAGSNARLGAAFRAYVAALIHCQRLACLRDALSPTVRVGDRSDDPRASWDVFAPGNAGFHPIETSGARRFRWSEPAAILPGWMPAGRHRIRIDCLPVRCVIDAQPRLFLDGRRLPARDVTVSPRSIEIRIEVARSGSATLAWTCTPFAATGDRRRLGLPVERVAWRGSASSAQADRCSRIPATALSGTPIR